MYKVGKYETTPQNFFAGEFPTLTETGTAAAALEEHTPVYIDENGKVAVVTAAKATDVIGITASEKKKAAEKDAPVVYYMTGEFFATGVKFPSGVTAETLKPILRKSSIFLR